MNKSELIIAFPIKKLEFDPHRMEDIYSMTLMTQVHSSLLRYLANGEIEKSVAGSWKVSADGLSYSFQLNEAKFSDGSKIKASDVERSLKRIFVKKASISADMSSIAGVSIYNKSHNPQDIQIFSRGDDQVEIKLERPNAVFLKQLATPDAAILKLGEDFNLLDLKISSGKYKIKQLSDQEIELELVQRDSFTSINPAQKIKVQLISNDPFFLAQNGQIDLMTIDSSAKEQIDVLKSRGWNEFLGSITQENFFIMNPKKVPLPWRKFFFQRFNSNDLLAKLAFNNKEPAYGYVPGKLQGAIKSPFIVQNHNEHDLKSSLDLEIFYFAFGGVDSTIDYFKSIWTHPKLKLKFTKLPVDQYLDKVFKKELEAFIATKGLDYPDAMANLSYFKSDLNENFFMVNDVEVDRLLKECSISADKNDRCFYEIQERIFSHVNVLPLFFGSGKIELWSGKVKNVPPHPLGIQFLSLDQIEMNP